MVKASVGEYCSLCSNPYDVPRNENGVLTYIDTAGSIQVVTCAEAYGKAQLGEFANCNDVHFMSREYCDCGTESGTSLPPSSSPKCTLCADGSELADPDFVVAGFTCKQWQRKANLESDESCYAYQSSFGLHCGCNEPNWNQGEYKQYCRFCPGSGSRLNGEDIAFTNQGFQYCTKLELDINLYPIHSCETEQMTYRQQCGCEDISVSPPPTCNLCSDGSPLQRPNKLVAGQTCKQWEIDAGNRPAKECASYQASLGVACGCDAPDFSQGEFKSYCKLCSYGFVRPNKCKLSLQGDL